MCKWNSFFNSPCIAAQPSHHVSACADVPVFRCATMRNKHHGKWFHAWTARVTPTTVRSVSQPKVHISATIVYPCSEAKPKKIKKIKKWTKMKFMQERRQRRLSLGLVPYLVSRNAHISVWGRRLICSFIFRSICYTNDRYTSFSYTCRRVLAILFAVAIATIRLQYEFLSKAIPLHVHKCAAPRLQYLQLFISRIHSLFYLSVDALRGELSFINSINQMTAGDNITHANIFFPRHN